MESINFHLLRHLGWQAKNIGPLFTTSAAMFESANRLLIAPLTGTVNQCQLMVWRFVRAKMIAKMSFKDECLTEMLTNFHEKRKLDENYGFVESSETRKFRQEHPKLKLFCRNLDFCFLSSAAYGRGCTADKYVAAFFDGEMIAGEILFFFRGIANNCVLRKFKVVRKLTLIKSQAQPHSDLLSRIQKRKCKFVYVPSNINSSIFSSKKCHIWLPCFVIMSIIKQFLFLVRYINCKL